MKINILLSEHEYLNALFWLNGNTEVKIQNIETETNVLVTDILYVHMVLRVQNEHTSIAQTVELLLSFVTSE